MEIKSAPIAHALPHRLEVLLRTFQIGYPRGERDGASPGVSADCPLRVTYPCHLPPQRAWRGARLNPPATERVAFSGGSGNLNSPNAWLDRRTASGIIRGREKRKPRFTRDVHFR